MSCKYVIIIPDGAADNKIAEFDNKTIFEAAEIPNIDRISMTGKSGLVQTVDKDMTPGSDVAMMGLLGYDPVRYYTGRAPIEAVAQGIEVDDTDWIFRCNLVTIADDIMADHSAGHISTEEGVKLLADVDELLGNENVKFHPGVSYRHLCIIKNHNFDINTTPPHDIIDEPVAKYMPHGKGAEELVEMMNRSRQLFAEHEINKIRKDLGENSVSSIWLWGQGKKAKMESFQKRFGLNGAAITAVDLVRGLAKLIDFDVINVKGATGFVDTNYAGKATAAIKAIEEYDIVLVHVEAPDEAGHAGNPEMKKQAVELIDKHIVGPVYDALQSYDQWRVLVMPDHPTPVSTRGHSGDAVPFTMAGTGIEALTTKEFNEDNAASSGLNIEKGYELMEYFLKS